MTIRWLIFALPALAAAAETHAAPRPCATARGGERAAILDTLRAPVSSDLRTKVEFVVDRARVCGSWAFVITRPQAPGGQPIHWATTPCGSDSSRLAGGLLRRVGDVWRVVDYALCPSDVAWADWPEKYGAPQALFED